ncbi:unnamed protein product [Bathycoccus prasinos]
MRPHTVHCSWFQSAAYNWTKATLGTDGLIWNFVDAQFNVIRTFNPYENLPLPGTRDDDEYSKTYDVIPYDPPFVHSHALNFELGCNDFSSACQAHFMYMSMLTSSVILRPTKETTEMLSERYFENLHQVRSPTVILQIRQSDKKGEDPYYNVFGGYRG